MRPASASPLRPPALLALAATLVTLACWAVAGEREGTGVPAEARAAAQGRAADLRPEPLLHAAQPGALLHADLRNPQLPAPVVRGGAGFAPERTGPGPLALLRRRFQAQVDVRARAGRTPARPLAVNRLGDHPDVRTCPACGPPLRP